MFTPKNLLYSTSSKTFLKNVFVKQPINFRLYSERENYDDVFKFYNPRDADISTRPISDYKKYISKRSALREYGLTRKMATLAYKLDKDFMSLAEGMPNEQVFPFTKLSVRLRDGGEIQLEGHELATALQYMPTQGMPDLVSTLREFQAELHRPPDWHQRDVLVTSGGQFGIYSCVDMLLEPGAPVMFPQYTYGGTHSVLKPYQPEVIGLPEDNQSIIPEHLESILEKRLSKGLLMPKFLYIVPNGSNPSGTVLPEERKRKIYELACEYDFLIVEDDPYMFMSYTDDPVPSFLSLDVEGRVIRLDSVSKVLSSGLRIGWVTAPKELLHRLELHLQADHLHTCTLAQALFHRTLTTWGRAGFAKQLRSANFLYRSRRDALHVALQRHCGSLASWSLPDAGMFFWLRLNVDDVYDMVFKTAFERGLVLIPGHAFNFYSRSPSPYLRLAFSKIPVEDMDAAARLLAEIIRSEETKARPRLATQL